MNLQHESLLHRTRRQFLGDASMGLGAAAMASMGAGNAFADVAFDSTEPLAPRKPHFAPKAKSVISDIAGTSVPTADGSLRGGHEAYEYAGYIKMGSPRPPFSFNMDETEGRARQIAANWNRINDKYRAEIEAGKSVSV